MRILVIIVICILQIYSSFSQINNQLRAERKYDFIQYHLNRIIFPGDSTPMMIFFKKMENVMFYGKGQINILHFGGSHIQADVYSGVMRRNIQNFYPGIKASRGLVFPYRMAQTNNPSNYSFTFTGKWEICKNTEWKRTCTLGLMGLRAETKDSVVELKFRQNDNYGIKYDFNRVKIFCNLDSISYQIVPKGFQNFTVDTNYKLGYLTLNLSAYSDSLDLIISKKDSLQGSFTLYGLSFENDDPGIYYHTVGVNGASVPSYLRCELLEKQIGAMNLDLVVFAIGVNDAAGSDFNPEAYKENYRNLIEKIKKHNPQATFLFITNNDNYRRIYKKRTATNTHTQMVKTAMHQLAAEYQCGVWDLYEIMGGFNSIVQWERAGLAQKDKVHFTSAGYTHIGELFFEGFIQTFVSSLIAKP